MTLFTDLGEVAYFGPGSGSGAADSGPWVLISAIDSDPVGVAYLYSNLLLYYPPSLSLILSFFFFFSFIPYLLNSSTLSP